MRFFRQTDVEKIGTPSNMLTLLGPRGGVGGKLAHRQVFPLITHWEKLLDSDWLRHCEFIRNFRANSVIRGKLQISRAKSVIHSECKYKKELTVNNE